MLPDLAAVVLAGGRGRRLGGRDKASLVLGGRTLLDRALATVARCSPVLVVGPPGLAVPDGVRRVQEDPPYGGPAAGLLSALESLPGGWVVVTAVDQAGLTPATVERLAVAARQVADADGAVLVDGAGRRQPALVLDVARLMAVAPPHADRDGLPLHRLLGPLTLHEVAAEPGEAVDVDTPEDLTRLGGAPPL